MAGSRAEGATDDEVSGFVRSVYTLLRVCDAEIAGWSHDGLQVVIFDPARFASELCPKFFRHRNFQSFTRLLNMYQFHRVPSAQRDSKRRISSAMGTIRLASAPSGGGAPAMAATAD